MGSVPRDSCHDAVLELSPGRGGRYALDHILENPLSMLCEMASLLLRVALISRPQFVDQDDGVSTSLSRVQLDLKSSFTSHMQYYDIRRIIS